MPIRPLLALLLLLLSAARAGADEMPSPRLLPLPLALGGLPGFWGPSPGTADLAAHLRGALLFGTERPGAPALSLRWNLGASVSLWRWAEAGVRFSGRWDLDARMHAPGPVELWLRAGPPDLRGAAVQAVLEQAAGRGGFDEGGRLWTSTTNLGAAVAARPWRFHLAGSLTYERASDDRPAPVYQGLRASAGLWFAASRAGEYLGLDVGGDALVRLGGTDGPRGPLDLAAVFTVGIRLVDENGAAFSAGYGQGWGPGMPARFGLACVGWSYGRGYIRPAPALPPLLPDLEQWVGERLRELATPRATAPPSLSPDLHRPAPAPSGAFCTLAPPLDLVPPAVVVRDCVVAGPPVVLSRRPVQVAAWRETAADLQWAAHQVGHALVYGTAGIGCGVVEGVAVGFRCYDVQDGAYQLGRGLGQAGIGVAQMIVGGGGELAGVVLDSSVVGGPAGALVGVGSTALVLNGAYAVRGGARRVTEVVISAMTHREPAGVASAPVSKPKGAAPAGTKSCPSPDGCKGKPDHQEAVRGLVERAKREFPDRRRYDVRSNQSIEPESGLRRRPDAAVVDIIKKKVVKVYEAARANKDGVTPVARERKKVQEYDGKGIPSHVEIVR